MGVFRNTTACALCIAFVLVEIRVDKRVSIRVFSQNYGSRENISPRDPALVDAPPPVIINTPQHPAKLGRVAVCVTGQVRTLTTPLTDPSFPNQWDRMRAYGHPKDLDLTVGQSIQQNLYPALMKHGFDVYMVISTSGKVPDEPAVGDIRACEPLRPPGDGNRLFCQVIREVLPVPAMPDIEAWAHYYYPNEKQIGQLLLQAKDQQRCLSMIHAQQRSYGRHENYTHMVRLRPDTLVRQRIPPVEHLDFSSKEPAHRAILIVSKKACCCGNEDWFGIGETASMVAYFNRYSDFQTRPDVFPTRDSTWTSETFLKSVLSKHGTVLKEEAHIDACLIKPAHRQGTGQAG